MPLYIHGEYLDALEVLRGLPEDQVFVAHHPRTARYNRAETRLRYVLEHAVLVGVAPDPEREEAILLAVWALHPEGRRPGYYACFRVLAERGQAYAAHLYCFYDGTEGSPALATLETAQAFARSNGFEVTP